MAKWREKLNPSITFGIEKTSKVRVFGVVREPYNQGGMMLSRKNNVFKLLIGALFIGIAVLISSLFIYNFFNAKAVPPTITEISPSNGPIAGGTTITVSGSGFMGEYERVEALYFNGGAYIDTEVPTYRNILNIRYQYDRYGTTTIPGGVATTYPNMVFGASRQANGGVDGSYAMGATSATAFALYGAGTVTTSNVSNFTSASDRNDFTYLAPNFRINGTTGTGGPGSRQSTDATFLIGGSLAPLTGAFAGAGTFTGWIYSFQTTPGNLNTSDPMHNFVPVKKVKQNATDPDVYGVVDTTTGEFFGNSARDGNDDPVGTIIGGSWNGNTFEAGVITREAISPDATVKVYVGDSTDWRECTTVAIIDDSTLRCNTPPGRELGKKDVLVEVSRNGVSEQTIAVEGFEYALRLDSITPKSGPTDQPTEIEIEGGVYSTPPEQFDSVYGIVFDGSSWIGTGFNQVGDTRSVITFKYPETALPNSIHVGFYGSRNSGSGSSNTIWQKTSASGLGSLRSDFTKQTSLVNTTFQNSNGTSKGIFTLVKDNGTTTFYQNYDAENQSLVTSIDSGSGVVDNSTPVEMLLGSLSHGGDYGTNSTSAAYTSFRGTMYSLQICKDLNNTVAVPEGTIYKEDDEVCGTSVSGAKRVLVRDLRASQRITDGALGFFDMITGDFITNAGYGAFAEEPDPNASDPEYENTNELENPLFLEVTFTGENSDGNPVSGVCTNPYMVDPTHIRCTMPVSPIADGYGKVDLTVVANGVEAISGTANAATEEEDDANDFFYGDPLVIERVNPPRRGPVVGGQEVNITGKSFYPRDPYEVPIPDYDASVSWRDIAITIGNAPCEFDVSNDELVDPNHYQDTSLTCYTTSSVSGLVGVTVVSTYLYEYIDGDGLPQTETIVRRYTQNGSIDPLTGVVTSGYLYEGDLISVSPNIGPTTGGTTVTINGSGFLMNNVTTQVFFGNVVVNPANVRVLSSTQIEVITPRSTTTGVKNVSVIQTGQAGYAASFTSNPENGFEYEFQTGTGTLTPNRAYTTGGDTILITGQFDSQASATVTLTYGTAPNQVITTLDPQSVNVLSDTQIEVILPAHTAGVVLVTVNQHNTDIPIANLTYINPLTITNITPNVGPVGGDTVVTIAGTSFVPAGSSAAASLANLSVKIGTSTCVVASVTNYTNTSITCTTSAHTSGLVDVVVEVDTDGDPLTPINPNHTNTLINGYRYVNLELSITSSLVNLGVISGVSPTGTNSTPVLVKTNNPNGYTVTIRADDSNATTTNDNQLKCTTNQAYKFDSIGSNITLTDNTWGWNMNNTSPNTEPSTFRPILTTNSSFITTNQASLNNGADSDTYNLWFGAKTSPIQPPCTYRATVLLTAVANDSL